MATLNLQTTSSILGKTTTVSLSGTSVTSLLSNASSSGFVYKVRSIIVANAGAAAANITVAYYSAAALGGTAYPIVSTLSIPASGVLPILDSNTFIYMPDDSSIGVTAGTANYLTVTCAYEQVTADAIPSTGPSPGGLWVWGNNTNGQLGLNYRTNKSSPVQVGALTNWLLPVNAGGATSLINSSGNLFTCGSNSYGQLGQNDLVNRSSPTQVGALTNWTSNISGQSQTVAAIKSDGTLWAWGNNANGQTGLNDLVRRSSPVQVGALTNWAYVHMGGGSTMAIKTDGSLWAWGRNVYFGQLMLNDTVSRSSPVQVGSGTNWSKCKINAVNSHAIKTDGTLWTAGNGRYGRTGLNSATYVSSPVQIGTDTNWSKIGITTQGSGNYGSFAIKTNGTIWSWGKNTYGALGQNSPAAAFSAPTQIGALTTWSIIGCADTATMAIKTDGTLWAIGGRNNAGQLALNNTSNLSSPTQVGGLTTWTNISGGTTSFFATKT